MPAASKPKLPISGSGRRAPAPAGASASGAAGAGTGCWRGAAGQRRPGGQKRDQSDHHFTPALQFYTWALVRRAPCRFDAICAPSTSAIRPTTRYIRQARLPIEITSSPETIDGAASENSQASQRPTLAWVEAKFLEGGKVGMEAHAIADPERGDDEERGGRRIAEEGHRRGDRNVGAQRRREQRRADDLDTRDHQEDADEQADGDPARDRPAGEAPQLGMADALAERLQPAALEHFVAGRRMTADQAAEESREISHAGASAGPARASSRALSRCHACRAFSCPARSPVRPWPARGC